MTFKWAVLASVLASLIAAAVFSALVWGSQGGLVHVLGGITSKEVEDLVKKRLPSGAVVAFDLPEGCPDGWIHNGWIDVLYAETSFDLKGFRFPKIKHQTACKRRTE